MTNDTKDIKKTPGNRNEQVEILYNGHEFLVKLSEDRMLRIIDQPNYMPFEKLAKTGYWRANITNEKIEAIRELAKLYTTRILTVNERGKYT